MTCVIIYIWNLVKSNLYRMRTETLSDRLSREYLGLPNSFMQLLEQLRVLKFCLHTRVGRGKMLLYVPNVHRD